MPEDQLAKLMAEYEAQQCTEDNLRRRQDELDDLKKQLEAEERELRDKEKRLLAMREKLHKRMTDTERNWERLEAELEELLYEPYGIVSQLRDGYYGPFDANEPLKKLCGEASRLIAGQGYADVQQYNYLIMMVQELASRIDDSNKSWLPDYVYEVADILMASES